MSDLLIIDCFQQGGVQLPWSNFFMRTVKWAGVNYPSNEHAYQAAKTFDLNRRMEIMHAATASAAKRMGNDRQKTELRPDWMTVNPVVMEKLVRRKFCNHVDLSQVLLETGNAIFVEGNSWGDIVWGAVRDGARNYNPALPQWLGADEKPWFGHNLLGQILMNTRRELQIESA